METSRNTQTDTKNDTIQSKVTLSAEPRSGSCIIHEDYSVYALGEILLGLINFYLAFDTFNYHNIVTLMDRMNKVADNL